MLSFGYKDNLSSSDSSEEISHSNSISFNSICDKDKIVNYDNALVTIINIHNHETVLLIEAVDDLNREFKKLYGVDLLKTHIMFKSVAENNAIEDYIDGYNKIYYKQFSLDHKSFRNLLDDIDLKNDHSMTKAKKETENFFNHDKYLTGSQIREAYSYKVIKKILEDYPDLVNDLSDGVQGFKNMALESTAEKFNSLTENNSDTKLGCST